MNKFLKISIALLTTVSPYPAISAEFYTKSVEIPCGSIKVTAFSKCTKGESRGKYDYCVEQKIFIEKDGKSIALKMDGKLVENKTDDGKVLHTWLDAEASSMACVTGSDQKKYLLIGYSNGGNCSACEWYNIMSLDGKELASDRGRDRKKANQSFNAVYKKLGLPDKWPRDKFVDIPLW